VHTSLMLLNAAVAAGGSTKKSSSSGLPFLILIALFGVAYFVFLRPARNRQRAAATARKVVEVGDEVTTTAGLIATVTEVHDDYLTLEVAPGVYSKYLPAAVLRVNGPDEEPVDDAPDVSTHEVIDDPDASSTTTEPTDDTPDETAPA
jgi:preprotein translocase subunit YajC